MRSHPSAFVHILQLYWLFMAIRVATVQQLQQFGLQKKLLQQLQQFVATIATICCNNLGYKKKLIKKFQQKFFQNFFNF